MNVKVNFIDSFFWFNQYFQTKNGHFLKNKKMTIRVPVDRPFS